MQNTLINQVAKSQIEQIGVQCSCLKPLVAIHCLVYNHEKYIRDALDGFILQNTSFPFVAIVHEDVSTDGSAEIIKEYAEKYPDIIMPIFEKENQYSKPHGELSSIMCNAIEKTGAKYVAMCEGDDYWTDQHKLQKQIDFLEAHPDYSMCVTNYDVLRCESGKIESWLSDKEKDLTMEDLIMEAWRFCATASMVYKCDLFQNQPEEMKKLYVGDYPLCIYMRSLGKVRLLGLEHCCIYRYMSSGSWTARAAAQNKTLKVIRENARKEIHMLSVLDRMTGRKWHSIFKRREHLYLFTHYLEDYPTRAVMEFWKNPVLFYRNFSRRLLLEIHGLRQIKSVLERFFCA